MSIELYPYAQTTIFVGGRGEAVYENEIRESTYLAISLTFQHAAFTVPGTVGSLNFRVTFTSFKGEVFCRDVCVTRLQFLQSMTFVKRGAVASVEVCVTSDHPEDTGIPVTATVQSVSLDFGEERRRSSREKSKC